MSPSRFRVKSFLKKVVKFLRSFCEILTKTIFRTKKFQGFENLYFVSTRKLVVFTKVSSRTPFGSWRDFSGLEKCHSLTLPFRPSISKSHLKIFCAIFRNFLRNFWTIFLSRKIAKNHKKSRVRWCFCNCC